MDSLALTANNAVLSLMDAISKYGTIGKQERVKILALYLLHYLKHHSDFLYVWDEDSQDTNKFIVDRDLEKKIDHIYRNNLNCLLDSCFIQLTTEDKCVPIIKKVWIAPDPDDPEPGPTPPDPVRILSFLVTNATNWNDTDWDEGSAVMISGAYANTVGFDPTTGE